MQGGVIQKQRHIRRGQFDIFIENRKRLIDFFQHFSVEGSVRIATIQKHWQDGVVNADLYNDAIETAQIFGGRGNARRECVHHSERDGVAHVHRFHDGLVRFSAGMAAGKQQQAKQDGDELFHNDFGL